MEKKRSIVDNRRQLLLLGQVFREGHLLACMQMQRQNCSHVGNGMSHGMTAERAEAVNGQEAAHCREQAAAAAQSGAAAAQAEHGPSTCTSSTAGFHGACMLG